MKKLFLFTIAIVTITISFAQLSNKKLPSVAVHYGFIDYLGAADIRATSLTATINSKQLFKVRRMNPTLSISYLEGFTDNVDFAGTLSASYLKYPTSAVVLNPSGNDALLLEAAATANFKLLTDNYSISPFITIGVGASTWNGYFSAFAPVGLGIQTKIVEGTFMILNSQYRVAVSEKSAYHFYHSLGFASSVGERKKVNIPATPAPPVVAVVLDTDGDGVPDADDKCPTVAGLQAFAGCPDGDSDGIADAEDKCPTQAGLAKYQGCPIPDTDADGVNDEEDKCVTEKGFARYQGCPIPDTDGDGVNDEEDKCVDRKGPATNQGCPVIEKAVVDKINLAAKNIFFATGSAKLLPKSFKSLDEVIGLLKTDESLMVDIDGHTDATGTAEKNQTLSESRATAVKTYLVSKGIADTRLTATGFGPTKPIADNKTAAGKAKNRRTELGVRNF